MKKKIMIEGMSCEHCANAVKNVLEELGASDIAVDHEAGFAIADIDADDAVISEKIAEEEFEVVSVEQL